MRPRVLFVARTRYRLPLDTTLRRRFDAVSEQLDWRQLATSATGAAVEDGRFSLAPTFPVRRLDGLAFYALLPARVARELRRWRPDAVVAQGAQETALVLLARALARVPAKVILDVHGDWRTATRLYGSPLRHALTPLADALSRLALRRADGVRTVSGYTTRLVREAGVEPDAVFPAYMDLEPFLGPRLPLPARPTVLFVGVLERYKAIDVLAAAWPHVVAALPDARLEIVGRGTLAEVVERLVASDPERVRWTPVLDTAGVVAALDAATLLVLPSRSEGMGRVIVEAFARGRCVVGSRVGGIPDLVTDGASGLLVEPGLPHELAASLVRVLGDADLAERLGEGARAALRPWLATPQEFAARLRALVEHVLERPAA